MATILRKGPIHVRKVIAFDGSAGNGAVGQVVIFTITGRVVIDRMTGFVTESLASAGGGSISMGTPTKVTQYLSAVTATGWVANDWTRSTGVASTDSDTILGTTPDPTSENVTYDVTVGDITNGTVVIDAWYTPVTDDGALAGDDSDENAIDGYDLEEAMRIVLAALAGKVSGADTNTPVFRDIADTKDRISAATTAAGNRTAITLDAS